MLYVFCTSAISLETTVATRSCSATVRETKHGRISYIYFFCVFESGVLYENCIRRERVYSTLFLSRFFFVCLFFIILKKSCSFCIKARIRLRGRDQSKRIMSVKRVRTKWDESKVKHMNVLLFHCAWYSLKKSTCSGYVFFFY